VKQLLLQSQFDVCGEVGYGKAAVSLATEVKPDVVFCAMEKLVGRSAQTVESLIDVLPEAPVVVYSPDSDLELARQAMHSGACDFLPMPISQDDVKRAVSGALASEARRRMRLSGSPPSSPEGIVVTVFGPKGGIGKTTVVTNLSVVLARSGQSVVCLDADAGFGDVASMLDIQPERTIVELSQQIEGVKRETLPRFLTPHDSGLMVLPAPPMALDWRNVAPDSFGKVVGALARTFDMVLIDTSGILDELSLIALRASSFVLWITTTEYTSIRDSQAAMTALRSMSFPPDRIRLVINQTARTGDVRPATVAAALGQPIFWRIPYGRQVRRSAQVGRPVVEMAPSSKIAQNFEALGRLISGTVPEPKRGLLKRLGLGKETPRKTEKPVTAPALTREET
jgi:pilus assembly protein CpaE